jgi:hypothetical protein
MKYVGGGMQGLIGGQIPALELDDDPPSPAGGIGEYGFKKLI